MKMNIARGIVMLSCLCASLASQLASGSTLVALDSQQQQTELTVLRGAAERATQIPELKLGLPSGRGQVSLMTMYSSQQGSWHFEPFVHNGLFRAISGYQKQHPRAVVLRSGTVTLEQLHAALNDKHIMERQDDDYVLRYPLVIDPGAALRIDGATLVLYGNSGTAIINLGTLSLKDGALRGMDDGQKHTTDRPYRPFVMNWAGSKLHIANSDVSQLGYDGHLSRGITGARSNQQGSDAQAVEVVITDSHFRDMSVGLELSDGTARISDSTFKGMHLYAVDVTDTQLHLNDSLIEGVQDVSGIRITGQNTARIVNNRISQAAKSAVEVNQLDGDVLITGNRLGVTEGHGILLRDAADTASLLIEDNLIGGTGRTAIDGAGVHALNIVGNRIVGTPEYAISIQNETQLPGPLRLTGNHLEQVGKAMIRVEGIRRVMLGDNRYLGNPVAQNLLIGDLLPLQGLLLDATLRQGCVVGIDFVSGASRSASAIECPRS